MRVTDANDGDRYGTEYSNIPTFNSNNTKLFVYSSTGSGAFIVDFDPQSFNRLGNKQFLPTGIESSTATWSNIRPNILYALSKCCSSAKLYEIDTSTNPMTLTVIKDFTTAPNFQTNDYPYQMSVSENDDVFAFTHKREVNTSTYIDVGHVAYKRSTNSILYNTNSPNVNGVGVDEVLIDKSGLYLSVKLYNADSTGKNYYIKDFQTGSFEGLTAGTPDFSPGHSDSGTGTVVGFDNYNNRILRRNLSNPHSYINVFDLFNDWSMGLHISMRSNNENWALISTIHAND